MKGVIFILAAFLHRSVARRKPLSAEHPHMRGSFGAKDLPAAQGISLSRWSICSFQGGGGGGGGQVCVG